MKKIYLALPLLALAITACDPSKDSIDMPGASGLTSEQLANGFTVKQYSDETYTTEAADGNYFTFFTSPARDVTVYQLDEEGARNVLASGKPNGQFKIVPKRGNPSDQTYYVETREWDGTYITATKTANVFVPSELAPEMRLLASDSYGSKTWTWDTEFGEGEWWYGAVWGNMGYAAGSGEEWSTKGNACWWGAKPEELTDQLGHSDTGVATGEESADASMVIFDDGNIVCYDAGGNQIRKGKIVSVEGWTGERNCPSADGSQANWSYGTLVTTEGAILFPFQINSNKTPDNDHWDTTNKPTRFEILQLDANHLKLVYPQSGTGSWKEATWWAFKSNSDPEAALTNFETKAWTWDTEFGEGEWWYGAAWGNMGYAAGSGEEWSTKGNACWWGAKPEELTGQLGHSDTGVATGEESADAYMTFDWKTGTVKSYAADGSEIRSGKFEIHDWQNGKRSLASADGSQANWSYGTLHTDAGSILFPFQINSNKTPDNDHWDTTNKPTDFEILQLDVNHLKLVYPQSGTGSWKEATWWAFKKK